MAERRLRRKPLTGVRVASTKNCHGSVIVPSLTVPACDQDRGEQRQRLRTEPVAEPPHCYDCRQREQERERISKRDIAAFPSE